MTMPELDEQFDWIINLLNNSKTTYWIDDGTLLGIYRDHNLIESDLDIDIGVWYKNKDELRKVITEVKSSGYRVIKREYYRTTTAYSFYPGENPHHERTINIKLYRPDENREYAWSPIYNRRENVPLIRWHLSKTYWRLYFAIYNEKRAPTWPAKIHDPGTYWIPIQYYENVCKMDKFDTYAPSNVEEYLEFRFGDNWETPTDDWDPFTDDGGIRTQSPREMVTSLDAPQ